MAIFPEISFLRPDAIWVAAAIGIVVAAWWLLRRRSFVAFSAVGSIRNLRHHRASPVRRLPWLLLALAIAAIVVALMEPVLPFSESKIEAEGLDIVLVLDLSSSMVELMYTETPPQPRLAVTKRALRDFIKRRPEDRIGLVVFSTNAYVISPLTFDHAHLSQYVDEIDDTLLRTEGMTAIGEGIHMANVLLTRQSDRDAKNKVLIILTDGEHNAGRDPIEALRATHGAGTRAHLIGVDLAISIKQKAAVRELIQTIIEFGGEYFEADSSEQLEAANTTLSSIEKGRLTGRRLTRNEPIFSWFAFSAVVLVLAAAAVRTVPYFADFT